MAKTYLNHGDFNGSAGSHFFIALYYEIIDNTTVRFYAHAGSHDGYSAGGSSSAVKINGITVGNITSIPANSDFQVGYLDVTGSGVVTGTATCTTTWSNVGSASTSGSVSVGPFITGFWVNKRDETSVQYGYTASSAADYAWYSKDGANWTPMPSGGIISGLTPGEPCNFYLALRQQSTQTVYYAGPVQQTPYKYPYITSASNFKIGEPVTINLYNPLNRACHLYLKGDDGTQYGDIRITGASYTGLNGTSWVNWWYSTIPNKKSANYKVKMTVSSVSRDTTVTGGTYSITGSETPIVTTTAIDTGKTLDNGNVTTTLTGNNKKIIKYISDVKVDVTATAQNSATIISTSTKYGDNSAITGSSHTYTNVENTTFKGYGMDSRNLSTGVYASGLTLINYIKLTLEDVELYRDSQTSNTLKCKGRGNYFTGSFGATNNSLAFKLRYKERNSSTWGSWETKQMIIGTDSYSFDFTVGTNFDYTKTYDFEFEVADQCMTVTYSDVAKAGLPIQGLFENFHEAFGTKTFKKDNDGVVTLSSSLVDVTNTLINQRAYSSGWITEGTYSSNAKYLYVLLYGGEHGTFSAMVPISVFNTFTTSDPYLFKDGSTSLYQFAYDDGAIKGYFRSSATDYSVAIYEIA